MAEKNATTLEDILLPGTPDEVRERYLSLTGRTRTTDFGPLEEDVVVLDTETTGLSFKDCRLIEISAARLCGREVAERFETFVDPGVPPSRPRLSGLTGIRSIDVAGAPRRADGGCRARRVCGRQPRTRAQRDL